MRYNNFLLIGKKKFEKMSQKTFYRIQTKSKKKGFLKIKQHFFEKRNYEWKGKKFSKDQKILFILFYFFLLGLCHAKKFFFQQNFAMAKKKVPSKIKNKKKVTFGLGTSRIFDQTFLYQQNRILPFGYLKNVKTKRLEFKNECVF